MPNCVFCGSDCITSTCVACGNKLSAHFGLKLRFRNLRDLNAAILVDADDTIDVCFDLLNPYQSEVKHG